MNYGHIYIFFVLLIFEDTCGWKSAFLVNKLFIYYSPKSSIYYQFFFYVDHFKLLAIKSMKKQKQWSPVFGMTPALHHQHSQESWILGTLWRDIECRNRLES